MWKPLGKTSPKEATNDRNRRRAVPAMKIKAITQTVLGEAMRARLRQEPRRGPEAPAVLDPVDGLALLLVEVGQLASGITANEDRVRIRKAAIEVAALALAIAERLATPAPRFPRKPPRPRAPGEDQ